MPPAAPVPSGVEAPARPATVMSGDWVVSGEEERANEVIVLTGNLRVLEGGQLTLTNVTLLLNCSSNGQFGIFVEAGASLSITASYIGPYRPGPAFTFVVAPGAHFEMADTVLSGCGYNSEAGEGGLTIYANSSSVEGCLIIGSVVGLDVVGAWNVSVRGCCFVNCSDWDISCYNAHNLTLVGNSFSGAVHVSNSTGIVVANNTFSGGGWAGFLFDHLTGVAEFENNTIAGRPIVLLRDATGLTLAGEAGQVIVMNSTGITVEGLVLNNTVAAIQAFCSDVLVRSCVLALNSYGVLSGFSNVTVVGCAISSNEVGVLCYGNDSCWASLTANSSAIEGNYLGLALWQASLTAYGNRIAYNYYGIVMLWTWIVPLDLVARLSPGAPPEAQGPPGDTGAIEAHFNNIHGNSALGFMASYWCPSINITYNWWNSTTGPELSSEGDEEDPEEIYEPWLVDVLYEPWLTEPITLPDDGQPPVLFKAKLAGGPLVCDRVLVLAVAADPTGIEGAYFYVNDTLAYVDHRPPYAFTWNTEAWPDGHYTIKVEVIDGAGNRASALLSATVDNTPPEVEIKAPASGEFVRGSCPVVVSIADEHLAQAELLLDGSSLASWRSCGEHALTLDTELLSDGQHVLTLRACDLLGHEAEVAVAFVVDNTPPVIRALSISPEAPTPSEEVLVSVTVEDETSGVAEVVLSFNDGSGWANTTMTPIGGGRYEARLSARLAGTTVLLKVYARDVAGNWSSSAEHSYKVVSRLMPAILAMLAITGVVVIMGLAVGLSRRPRALIR